MLFRTRPNRPELDATKVPTAIDIAWSAGIYEGEGCCHLAGGKGKRGVMAAVAQKDPELLYRLRDWFGGSIRETKANGFTIHYWGLCGDRARIFMALIYEYMTARRKGQIDATEALDFLDGVSSVGMSMQELKDKLNALYQKHRETTWDSNPEWHRENSRAHYAVNLLNPEWVQKDRELKRNMRANMTDAQLEERRKYQRERYHKLKQKEQLSNVVEMKKIA
jgi:hypothetical protein